MDPLRTLFPSIFAYSNPDSYVNTLRRRRAALFVTLLDSLARRPLTVLDVGGEYKYWQRAGFLDADHCRITLLNLTEPEVPSSVQNVEGVMGDGTNLEYPDKSFDVIFSNSAIEHMGSRLGQRQMADEVQRVGKRHYIQTPNQWFPFEPHSRIPGFQFIPRRVRAALIYKLDINYFPRQPTYRECLRVSDSTMMLTHRQYRELFPDSYIYSEKLFGLPKSFTAIGGWDERMIRACIAQPVAKAPTRTSA